MNKFFVSRMMGKMSLRNQDDVLTFGDNKYLHPVACYVLRGKDDCIISDYVAVTSSELLNVKHGGGSCGRLRSDGMGIMTVFQTEGGPCICEITIFHKGESFRKWFEIEEDLGLISTILG